MSRLYLSSRAQRHAWAMDNPVGDPFGGAAFGERLDVGGVVGGLIGADTADDALAAQSAGVGEANALAQKQYQTARLDNAPFRDAGVGAVNMLGQLLGLPGYQNGAPPTVETLVKGYVDKNWASGKYRNNPALSGLTKQQLIDGWIGNYRSGQYGTADEARKALGYRPDASQGASANFGALLGPFSQADLDADPIYQNTINFALDQGNQGINRQAAASGNMLSGATLKALSRFGANTAATYGNDAFNRKNVQDTNTYNRLAGLTGAGQAATNTVTSAGQNYANTVGNNLVELGNARGASAIAKGNAYGGALDSALNFGTKLFGF